MSILITEMELPKDKEIFLSIDEKGDVYVYGSYPTELHKAVPVPPHGRLIDADEFFKALTMDDRVTILEAMHVQSILSDEPTVIPASEDGET